MHADWKEQTSCEKFMVQKKLPCQADTIMSHMAHVSSIKLLNKTASVISVTRTPRRMQHKCFWQT